MSTTTKTVGRGKSKGMAQGRQAAKKVAANAAKVADLNSRRQGELTREAAVQYLQTHGLYAGHSRDSVEQLRQAVADHRASTGGRIAAAIDKVATEGAKRQRVKATEPVLHPDGPERVAAAKAEHKALQAWIKDGEKPPRPATPNLDALNADHAAGRTAKVRHAEAKAAGTRRATVVPDDHPLLRYVDAELVGKPVPADLGLVHTVDSTGLVRVHKATCKPTAEALATWPERVYAAACCKPRTPGAVARTVYVPPSKRTA